jgi:serine/threonine protein kinase
LIKQKVAAKIIHKSNLKSKDLEEKIDREIKFSKYFRHPNIIRVYEVIKNNNDIIMIMEYAPGGELYDLICKQKVHNSNYLTFILHE